MFRKTFARRKRLPIPMTIRRGNGGSAEKKRRLNNSSWLPAVGKNCRQFLRRNDLELSIGAVVRLFVAPPSAKLRRMTKAVPLHVVVCDFDHQFGTQRFP